MWLKMKRPVTGICTEGDIVRKKWYTDDRLQYFITVVM